MCSICTRFYLDDEWLLTIPDGHLIDDRDPSNCFTGFYDFGAPWDRNNPWTEGLTCDHFMAPFDQDVSTVFLGSITMYQVCLVGGSHSYCSLKPLWLGMGEVVLARTSLAQ